MKFNAEQYVATDAVVYQRQQIACTERESLARKCLANLLFSSIWRKFWQMNRSAKRLLTVITNLDGFSLANHGRFAKFPPVKLSRYMVLETIDNRTAPLYYLCRNTAGDVLWTDLEYTN